MVITMLTGIKVVIYHSTNMEYMETCVTRMYIVYLKVMTMELLKVSTISMIF